MRTVTPPLQAKLNQTHGTEPILLVEIEWVAGSPILYSDQKIAGADYPYPTILKMGGFDTSMMLSGSSDSMTLNLTLDDIDGHLKDIYLANDVHMRPVKVYLTYKGLSLEDKTLLFNGEVVTPFQWDEGKRTLGLTVLSKLEETEAGFSMEEGDFPNIPEEALGKAWPLVFGQVCHVPAVQIRASRRGYLLAGEGIHDFTLHPRICQATKIQCPSANAGVHSTWTQGANNDWAEAKVQQTGPSQECVNRRFGEICKLKDLLEKQQAYENPTLSIYNGVSFPQGETVTIWIDGAEFKGSFTGNTFTISDRKHPEYDDFDHVQCRNVRDRYYGSVAGHITSDWNRATNNIGGDNTSFKYGGDEVQAFADCDAALVRTIASAGGPSESWKAYEDMESSDFFWMAAGTEVFMEGESEHLFVASLMPATVDKVSAYRTLSNGKRILVDVPTSYYTVYETDYDGYQVVEIGFDKKLSLIDEELEDQIYVSMTSTLGPNVADSIQWLVEKYTTLSVDATSFAAVKAATTAYPCNFALLERVPVYQLMQDLAYQSRCSVYIRNSVVYLTYLSVEPSSVRTLDESDIVLGTFMESLSETDDIMTTHKITWQKAGARVRGEDPLDFKIILKYNVKKYGTSQGEWNYYTQNNYETILKSATFWLIRKACSWKKLEFNLPVQHIDLDVNDCVTIDVAQFSATPVKCIIEMAQYDPDGNLIHVVAWTPIRSGETEPYYWAWPAAQAATAVWPLPGDTQGGAGYDFDVTPPVNHVLLGGSHNEDQIEITTGDRNPSDLDDVAPVTECLVSDLIDFDEEEPEIVALEVAQSVSREAMDQDQGGGGGGASQNDKDDDDSACGFPVGGGCGYKINITWHRSESQGVSCDAPGCPPCGGPCKCIGGCPSCTGPSWVKCHTFGAAWGAQNLANYYDASSKSLSDTWSCLETATIPSMLGAVLAGRTVDEITGQPCDPVGETPTPPADGKEQAETELGTATDA